MLVSKTQRNHMGTKIHWLMSAAEIRGSHVLHSSGNKVLMLKDITIHCKWGLTIERVTCSCYKPSVFLSNNRDVAHANLLKRVGFTRFESVWQLVHTQWISWPKGRKPWLPKKK